MALSIATPPPPSAALEVVQDRAAARCLLHPVRLRIVEHLVHPDSASGVGRRLRIPRQKVNYHLRELERHGLVRLVREERHGAGTERRLQARAKAYTLGPRLLGRLSPDRALTEAETPEVRILMALTRAVRELGSAVGAAPGKTQAIEGAEDRATQNQATEDQAAEDRSTEDESSETAPGAGTEPKAETGSLAAVVEADLVVADSNALRDFAQDLRNAVEFLTERYRSPTGLSCHLVLAVHPTASYAASLPPPIATPAEGWPRRPADGG